MQNDQRSVRQITLVIVVGILFFYVMQMSPSPILLDIRDYYGINNNDMLLNMCVSISFATIVLGCITGAKVEQKLGNRNLFIVSALLVSVGGLMSLVSFAYPVLLAARAVWGYGFGLSVQFIGSAIMLYYDDTQREQMNTLNGMFPFIGTIISYLFCAPVSKMVGVKAGLAVWTIPIIAVLIVWVFGIKKESFERTSWEELPEEPQEKNLYGNLLGRRPIRLLCITFICDFVCYSYMGVIVPTLFYEATEMSQETAGLVAAIAFPACGIVGGLLGGAHLNRTGLRKPTLLLGQMGKFIGLALATVGCSVSPVLLVAGVGLFGISNALWMPAFYCVPMDLEGMTPTLSGAAFSLMTACGMIMGFVGPTLGGILTNVLMEHSGITGAVANHVFGLKWSMMIFACANIISTICMLLFKETGTRRDASAHAHMHFGDGSLAGRH